MTTRKDARKEPFDDLVLRVCHVELSECNTVVEFREGIEVMRRNLEQTLATLSCYVPPNPQIGRAASKVKMKAVLLLEICRGVPKSFDDPERWREIAINTMSNYEQFRIEAGHLYQLAVPRSNFAVLRAAL